MNSKNIKMKKLLLLSLAITFSVVAIAQEKITEGIITSKQTISSENPVVKAQMESMGEIIGITYFKGSKSRAEISNEMTGDITVISDAEKMKTLTLMDSAMGKNYMAQSTELTEEQLDAIEITEGTETKTILGYDCKEQIITISQNGIEMKMIMFITKDIEPILTQQTAMLGDKIQGFPLYVEMTMNQQGIDMTITTEIIKIEKIAVSDDKFNMTPPEGYTELGGM